MSNLFDRIKHTVEKFRAQLPTYDQPAEPELAPEQRKPPEAAMGFIPQAQMVSAITKAGRSQRLIYIRYKGVWRHVESYEFKGGKQGLLIYGWCLMDNETHSFYVSRIQEMYLTDIPFTARFPIKV